MLKLSQLIRGFYPTWNGKTVKGLVRWKQVDKKIIMLWLSLNCNLKLVLVGNVGFFRGIVGKVLTLSNPLLSRRYLVQLSRCYLAQPSGRSYENPQYYFYTYFLKCCVPTTQFATPLAENYFQTPFGHSHWIFKKTLWVVKIVSFKTDSTLQIQTEFNSSND